MAEAAPIAVDLRGAAPGPAPAPARRVVVRRGRATRRPQEDAAPAQPPPEADEEAAAPPRADGTRQSGGDGTRRKRLTRFITLIVLTCLAAAVATGYASIFVRRSRVMHRFVL